MATMIELLNTLLLIFVVVVLLTSRLSVYSRLTQIERDLGWMRALLAKWGMVPPSEESKK